MRKLIGLFLVVLTPLVGLLVYQEVTKRQQQQRLERCTAIGDTPNIAVGPDDRLWFTKNCLGWSAYEEKLRSESVHEAAEAARREMEARPKVTMPPSAEEEDRLRSEGAKYDACVAKLSKSTRTFDDLDLCRARARQEAAKEKSDREMVDYIDDQSRQAVEDHARELDAKRKARQRK